MAALRVPGPSSAWFLAAVASMSRASSSGDLADSVLRGPCVVVPTPYAGASLVLGRLDGMSSVGCTRHPSVNAWQRRGFLGGAGLRQDTSGTRII